MKPQLYEIKVGEMMIEHVVRGLHLGLKQTLCFPPVKYCLFVCLSISILWTNLSNSQLIKLDWGIYRFILLPKHCHQIEEELTS